MKHYHAKSIGTLNNQLPTCIYIQKDIKMACVGTDWLKLVQQFLKLFLGLLGRKSAKDHILNIEPVSIGHTHHSRPTLQQQLHCSN